MKFSFELSTLMIVEPGSAMPLEYLHQAYGEGSRIEIQLLREGVPVTEPSLLEEFFWCVKRQNKFSGAALVACDAFEWDEDIERWVGEVNYNVSTVTTQLAQVQGEQDESDSVMLWAQLAYRPQSSAGWQRSQIIRNFRVDNVIWKGDESVPGVGDPVEPTTGPWDTVLLNSISNDVVNNDATANTMLDISALNFPVEAGFRYRFEFDIFYDAAATTTGARFGINGPTLTELLCDSEYSLTTTTVTTNRHVTAYDFPTACNATSGWTAGNRAKIEGWIKTSVSGFVIARFASKVSGSAITVKAGSCVKYAKVG